MIDTFVEVIFLALVSRSGGAAGVGRAAGGFGGEVFELVHCWGDVYMEGSDGCGR